MSATDDDEPIDETPAEPRESAPLDDDANYRPPADDGGDDDTADQLAELVQRLNNAEDKIRRLEAQVVPRIWLPPGSSPAFPVALSAPAGGSGSPTTPAAFTYTVKDLLGNTLGTAVGLWFARPNGNMTAGTHGLAFLDPTNVLKLAIADEVPGTSSDCAT